MIAFQQESMFDGLNAMTRASPQRRIVIQLYSGKKSALFADGNRGPFANDEEPISIGMNMSVPA